MKSILIKDTTREEREAIVRASLDCGGGCENCSSCWLGGGSPWDIYQDYIDGKREIKEINMGYMEEYRQNRQITWGYIPWILPLKSADQLRKNVANTSETDFPVFLIVIIVAFAGFSVEKTLNRRMMITSAEYVLLLMFPVITGENNGNDFET